MNCSTNGFQSHKQKEGVAAAVTADEVPSRKSGKPDNDSSGMDLKDWISRPSGAANKESNKNSADFSSASVAAQEAATNAESGDTNAGSKDTTANDTVTNAASEDTADDAASGLAQNDNAAEDGVAGNA